MPPKDDDDPASTKEVVTKKQKQLLNREEMDLNLIAESLGGFVIEGRRRKKYRGRNQGSQPVQTTPQRTDPRDFIPDPGSEVKNPIPKKPGSGPRVSPGPNVRDFPGYDAAAEADAQADIEADLRRGRVNPSTQSPRPQGPSGTSSNLWSRIRAAYRDAQKSMRGSKSGGLFPALGTVQTILTAPSVFQNMRAFDPNYKATEDPKSPLYQPPKPEVDKLIPPERKTPPTETPPTTKPAETEPAGDPAQTPDKKPPVVTPKDPDGDRKTPPVTVNPPTGVGVGDKTGSKQGATTSPQGQLSQIAQGAATTTAIKQAVASRNKKGKFKFGVPQQPRGRIGRRQNPQ